MRKIKKTLDRNLLVSAALFLMTLCIFGPLELYITNRSELWFSVGDALKISGILTLVTAIILGGISALLKGKARDLFAAVIFAFSLCAYIQGNYLNISYGVLDGREIEWNSYLGYAIGDTLFWVAAFSALLVLRKKNAQVFKSVQKYGSIFIILIQLLSLSFLAITDSGLFQDESKDYHLSKNGIMEVGSERNIVIFVLDTFDDTLMDSLMQANKGKYEELFSDFVRFTDCAAGGATTAAAMPIIIAGQNYCDGMSYYDYINTSFNANGLYSELREQGYCVDLYTESLFVGETAKDYIDNVVCGEEQINSYAGLAGKYSSFTLFKYMPHLAKRFFWVYTDEFSAFKSDSDYVLDDADFYSALVSKKLEVGSKNVYHLIHLAGAHYPYTINEFAQPTEEATREEQAEGALYIVEEYLNQMKALSVYDNSMVIITADHGDSQNYAHPILFVKDRGATGTYVENDAPVSHWDLTATLFDYLGKDKGDTFFEIPKNEKRSRLFYLMLQERGNFYMQEYLIEGSLDSVGCGVLTGRKLAPIIEMSAVILGERMTLGLDGTANKYIVSGLDVWPIDSAVTTSTESEFLFMLEKEPNSDLEILIGVPKIYDEDRGQEVTAYANGNNCYTGEIKTEKEIRFVVPRSAISDNTLRLKLVYKDQGCPLFISSITISTIE